MLKFSFELKKNKIKKKFLQLIKDKDEKIKKLKDKIKKTDKK